MLFVSNPYYQYGNANMSSMPWSTPTVNNSFSYTYPRNASKSYSQPRNSVKSKGQRPTPKVKVDLTSSGPKEEKQVPKPKASTNRPGPKAVLGIKIKMNLSLNVCMEKERIYGTWTVDAQGT